jgi:predicted ester cyclase
MNMLVLATLFLALVPIPAALADDAANEALARRFYTEFNARNFDAYDEFIAADLVDHSAPPNAPTGLAAVKEEMKGFAAGFSDMQLDNEQVFVSGDHVTVISRAHGTNDGPTMNMPATNKPVDFQTIDVWLVKDGKLSEVWHVEQLLQMMTQLGVMEGSAGGGAAKPGEAPAASGGSAAPAP